MAEEAPDTVEVPASTLGFVIGPNGSTIKRLIQSTKCQIEVPRGLGRPADGEDKPVAITLQGTPAQRRAAAQAIKDVSAGGDVEDQQARADGALVVGHSLENRDREAWTQWRMTCWEHELGIKTEIGRRNVRCFSAKRGGITGEAAKKVRAAIEECIKAAEELVELEVEALLETDPQDANWDQAIHPLVDQYGVLLRIPLPEDGVVKLRIIGPEEPARDMALLLESRYAKKNFTASILQAPGQVQGMSEGMAEDWSGDMRNLEQEYSVKVKESHNMIWLVGENAEGVQNARRTLAEMLPFYMPQGFQLRESIPQDCVNEFKMDPCIRGLIRQPDCAIQWDRTQGTAWICGSKREAVNNRLDELMKKWETSHWEQELEDYGVAMWLLGPKGSGDWLHRMQSESGAKMKVCPNALKVWVESPDPAKLEAGKQAMLQGLERLQKKKADDEAGIGPGPKVKEVLSGQPPHMQAMMEKLAMLEAMRDAARVGRPTPKKLYDELLKARGLKPLDELDKPAEEPTEARERSRSRDRPARSVVRREVMEFNPATGEMEASTVEVEVDPATAGSDAAPMAVDTPTA